MKRPSTDASPEIANWATEHGATADHPAFLPSWRHPPACLEGIAVLAGNPSIAGWNVHLDGRVTVVHRGKETA